jgi:hypothetical protein
MENDQQFPEIPLDAGISNFFDQRQLFLTTNDDCSAF